MAEKRKAKDSSGPSVLYLADADAEPEKATVLNAAEGQALTGYENLTLETKDGTVENVPGELGGPGSETPRWRLTE